MPSHAVHGLLATKYLGLPVKVVRSVDEFIDLRYFHDVGRKKPRELPAYSGLLYGEQAVDLSRLKSLEAELNAILSDRSMSLAFYFHHALDILAYRVASVITLGLYSDAVCRVLARGVMGDLQFGVDAKLKEMGIHVVYDVYYHGQVLENAIALSCTDSAFVSWVRENIVPEHEKYRSLDYIKKVFSETIPKIIASDARYEVGYRLGFLARISRSSARSSKIEIVDKVGDTMVGVSSSGIGVDIREVEKEVESRSDAKRKGLRLSPYGLGKLREEVVKLSALYSGLYHVLLVEPIPLEISFKMWLAMGRKKYSLAMNILRCYKNGDALDARKCTEHDFGHMASSLRVVQKGETGDIKARFLQALEELMKYARLLNIDVLNGI